MRTRSDKIGVWRFLYLVDMRKSDFLGKKRETANREKGK